MSDTQILLSPKLLRRLQIISTVVVLFPSAGLLLAAYLSATRPEHSAAEAVTLAIAGIALPPLIYWLWSLIRWLRRGQEVGADPQSLAARLSKKPYLGFIPVAITLAILGVLKGSPQRDDPSAVTDKLRTGCIASADSDAVRSGANPKAFDVHKRIADYCGCFATQVTQQYAPNEFATAITLDSAGLSRERKLNRLMTTCSEAVDH
jgi:hypothetical protein